MQHIVRHHAIVFEAAAVEHLRGLAVATCALAFTAAARAAGAPARPNILFLLADNWLYDHAGANGDRVVKTPVFDRMAREGVRFTNAFCPVPSCGPTRSSLVTGRAAHQLEEIANHGGRFAGKFRVRGKEYEPKPEQVRVVYTSDRFPPLCFGVPHDLPPDLRAKVEATFRDFKFEGTSVGARYVPQGMVKFAPVNCKTDWQYVRDVDAALGKLADVP